MKKFTNAINQKATRLFCKATNLLKDTKGENFVDSAVKILIVVVLGALLLAGLYVLFKDTLLPTLTQKIIDLFNYSA